MTEPILRPSTAQDAERVAAIWLEGWRDGHLGHVGPDLVAARSPASFERRARERVNDTTVALDGDEVVGFAMVLGDEVEQIYVDRRWRGTGIAGALLRAGEHQVALAGYQRAWLAVVAGNTRARRFYEREGWNDEGEFDYHATVDGDSTVIVPARRYTKNLAVRASCSP